MKKTNAIKSIAAAALSLMAAGCAKEQLADNAQQSGVSFTVEVPGAPVTKAIGDGTTAKTLYYQVFDNNGEPISRLGAQTTTFGSDGKAKVNFQLVKDQAYSFIFWAQTSESGYYTVGGTEAEKDLRTITANYDGKKSNDENFDAFFAVITGKTITGPVSETVTLKRPFAQINIGTKGIISAGDASRDIVFTDATSAVTVTGVPTVFKPLANADTQLGTPATVTLATANAPEGYIKVNEVDYKYLAMNYVFAPEAGTVTDITATLTVEGKNVPLNVPNAPIKRNWRTNIVGNLLTAEAGIDVVIDHNFDDDEDIDLENIKNEASLKALFANGGTAKLAANIELENGLVLGAGKDAVIDLNGFDIINKSTAAAITVNGSLEIDGNGTVNGGEGGNNQALHANQGGKITINGGTFTVGKDASGEGNSCVETVGGEIIINGGYFSTAVDWRGWYYVLNQQNNNPGTIIVNGGQFENYDPTTGDDNLGGNFVADGYTSFKSSVNPVVYTVSSIAVLTANCDALREKVANGGEIIVSDNVLMTGYPYSVPAGKDTHIIIEENTTIKVKDGLWDPYKVFSFYNDGGTLSGNGTIIASNKPQRDVVCAVEVREGNSVVIEGNLHIDGGSNAKTNSAVKMDGGMLTIKGGHFTVGLDMDGGSNPCIMLYANEGHTKLVVEDGVFESEGDATYLINCQDENKANCEVLLMGGVYVGFNPADNSADGEHTNYVASGYKSVETTYNGKQAWKVVKE